MKILQLIPNLGNGGAERFVVDLCNELIKNHEVILLTLYDECDEDFFRKELNPQIQILSLGKRVGFDLKVIPRLYKTIKRVAPEVIHNHLGSLNYLLPLIPFIKNTPIVHTVHSDAFKECSNPKIRKVRQYFFRSRIRPVTISKNSAESFRKAYPTIGYTLIYNGRKFPSRTSAYSLVHEELKKYKSKAETKIFVNIGSTKPAKNQLMLIESFRKFLKETSGNAILLIIGGGGSMKESKVIQQGIKEAEKNTPQIHFLGLRKNATDYLYATDFLCLSSIFEGMPITLIESLATGTIPVCTPVGGIPEMVQELDASLLSKEVSVDSYCQALKRAYELSENEQQQLRDKARTLFKEKYVMEICAANYEQLYFDLINKK